MLMLASILRWLGILWVIFAGLFIAGNYISILIFADSLMAGLAELWDRLSPYNLWNWLAVTLMLSPGLIALEASKKLKHKATKPPSVDSR